MTEQIMALMGKQAIGPFPSTVDAALYLSELDIDDIEPITMVTPPPMSELLKKAFAFLRDNRGGNASEFLDVIAGTPEEGVSEARAEEALKEAHRLLDMLVPDRTRLTNEQLALVIYQECGANKLNTLKALRFERSLSLKQAHDAMIEAGLT